MGVKELVPLENRIIVVVKKNPFVKEVRDSGIIVPNTAKSNKSGKVEQLEDQVWYAEVLEIGPAVTSISKGDGILFSPYSGYPVPFYDKEFVVLRDTDVIAKITDGEDIL